MCKHKITMNEKEKHGPAVAAKEQAKELGFTTEEKAQYEVFVNGDLPKETITKWITNDLMAIRSFVQGCLDDPDIFNALATAYYERYKKLHTKQKDHVEKNNP